MKLINLNPHWVGVHNWRGPLFLIGLSFDCPHCRVQRLAVMFRPPIDPENCLATLSSPETFLAADRWERSGDTFETISLAPSVNADFSGHWHGFITEGEVT